MPQNKAIAAIRFGLIAILVASGVSLIVTAMPLSPRDLGPYLWLIGWVMIGVAGWLIPQRFAAGMVVGAALFALFPATVAIYRKWAISQLPVPCEKPEWDETEGRPSASL
jgi:hypothetical protein